MTQFDGGRWQVSFRFLSDGSNNYWGYLFTVSPDSGEDTALPPEAPLPPIALQTALPSLSFSLPAPTQQLRPQS